MSAAGAIVGILTASPASAQTDTQAWANVTLEWIKSHALTFSVDMEPKVLVLKPADQPAWATLDVVAAGQERGARRRTHASYVQHAALPCF